MRTRRALLLVLIGLMIPGVRLAFWLYGSAASGPSFEGADVPARLGHYAMLSEQELGWEALAQIQPERYVMRTYGHENGGEPVGVYVSFHRGRALQGAHDPAVCYPAQGWEVTEKRETELLMPNGRMLTAEFFGAFKGGRFEWVLYWFQPVGRWPGSALPEVFRRVLDSVRGDPQYAFIRLSMPDLGEPGQERRILDFARLIGPEVRRMLEPMPGT